MLLETLAWIHFWRQQLIPNNYELCLFPKICCFHKNCCIGNLLQSSSLWICEKSRGSEKKWSLEFRIIDSAFKLMTCSATALYLVEKYFDCPWPCVFLLLFCFGFFCYRICWNQCWKSYLHYNLHTHLTGCSLPRRWILRWAKIWKV